MNDSVASVVGLVLQALAWTFFFTQPSHNAMLAVVLLVLVDWITGIWAAKKRGEKISSWGWRRTIYNKIIPYQVAILCSLLVDNNIFKGSLLEHIQLMKATAAFISGAEIKSVYENLGSITGLDFWTFIKEKLQPRKDPPKE